MNVKVYPARLEGRIEATASKSSLNRLLIAAALADGSTEIRAVTRSADIEAMVGGLRALGADIREEKDGYAVAPIRGEQPSSVTVDCRESGSMLRFLLPVACALGARARFIGRGQLPERPIGDLLEALRARGAEIAGDALPVMTGGGLRSGLFLVPGHISSQYATGLLFALPRMDGESEILFTSPPASRGYLEMTHNVLSAFGVRIHETPEGYRIPGGQLFSSPGVVRPEGDWSGAAFFLAANALGNAVEVGGLLDDSAQGDRMIGHWLKVIASAPERAVDLHDVPDLGPILAVVAALTPGRTRFIRAGRLREKESDRLNAMGEGLNALGGRVRVTEDGWIIDGVESLRGGAVRGAGDHRIVMSLSIAALRAEGPVTISDAEAVNKSYPEFFRDFQALGGIVDGL